MLGNCTSSPARTDKPPFKVAFFFCLQGFQARVHRQSWGQSKKVIKKIIPSIRLFFIINKLST